MTWPLLSIFRMDDAKQTTSFRSSFLDGFGQKPARMNLRQVVLGVTSAVLFGSLAAPANAAEQPRAKLVSCGAESCLRIAGTRPSQGSVIAINDRVVTAEGGRSWKVDLPLETVRQWSAPHARTVEVSLHDPATQREIKAIVDLPIGLLGGVTDLALLVVSSG